MSVKGFYIRLWVIGVMHLVYGLGCGQTTVSYDFSPSGAVSGLNEASPGITLDINIGFGSFINSGTSNPGIFSNQLRLYQNSTKGGSIIIYANNGVTITDVVINASGTTGPAGYTVDGGAQTNLSSNTTYSINGISATSQVEFFQRDGSSSNRIYVDSFDVTYISTGPTISVTENAISNLNYTENNGPSTEKSFLVSGSVLTAPIVLTAPTNFEISTSAGSGYSSQVSLPIASGSVATTPIYVRLVSGLLENTYSGTLTATSMGASQQDVALSGEVTLYCTSSFTDNNADAITNVTINTLDNDSGDAHASNTNGYEAFTSLVPTDLEQGQTYNLSVSIDSNGFFLYHIFAFFDWDGDLDFDSLIDESYDLGDNESTSGDLSTHDINITVPSGASLGNTRMRIVIMSADPLDPNPAACDPQDNNVGETEDYTINIISATSCNLTSLGLSNISCSDNGTPLDSTDDITSFQLNPTGNNLGTTYSVDMDIIANISTNPTGPFTTDVIGISYGSATTFYLEPGSAGIGGDIEAIVYDDTDNTCIEIATITDPGACSFGGGTDCGIELDFETPGGYTTSIPEFTDGSNDYFIRTDSSNISGGISFTNINGSFFAAQDIDGEGVVLPVDLIIENIDISNLLNLEFSIDLAEDDDGLNEDWDAPDFVHIYYSIDGGEEQDLLWIENDGSTTNSAPFIDTNFDGVGDGAEITDTFTTFTRAISGTGNLMDVRIEFSLDSGDEDIALDNIRVCGIDNGIDSDSQVNVPNSQIPAGTIVADATTLFSDAIPIFKFEVQDLGTADGFDTVIEQFRIVPGSGNTAIWSQVIQGVEVVAEGSGGQVTLSDQNVIVNDTEIIIQILDTPQNEMTTDDADIREYTIGVYLNETGIIDQEIIQLAIPSSTTNWLVVAGSSQFVSTFSGFEGSLFTIDVVGNGLEFITDALTTVINQAMALVQVANTDNNGNIDLSLTQDVELTSTGTLAGEPVSVSPSNGIAAFSGLTHTALGSGLTLTVTSSGVNQAISATFNIIEFPEIFITDVADPFDNFEARYVEIYNAGVTEINLDTSDYYLANSNNDGTTFNEIKLTGTIPAKSYFIIGREQNDAFLNAYGFLPNQLSPGQFGVISGNGDDSYFISLDNTDNTSLINSAIDVYGEIGADGSNELWDYLDTRAFRNNPIVKNANPTWTYSEWSILFNTNNISAMTPGYGDNDYIYEDGWLSLNTNLNFFGNPDGNSTIGQNIFIKSGEATLTQDTSIGDLVVRSGSTLTLAPNVKLTVAGDILNEGKIIFESDDNSTAVLEAVQPNTRVVGNGFEIQRRIPVQDGIRAFRYLSSSVDTQNSNKPYIYDNWQQGGLNPGDQDYESGFGTHITGSTTGANGFDATQTGNPSMYFWDNNPTATDPNVQIGWTSIPNTDATNFEVGDAYAILIRGDRNSPLDSNTATGDPTTLRTTGKIHVGNFEVQDLSSTDGHFNLIGNPYQSQVDLSELLSSSNSNSQGLDEQYIYIWDPTLGSLGGYATVDIGSNAVTNVSAGVPADSDASKHLQPNQAFFVQSTSNNPSLIFTEDDKDNSIGQTEVFSTETETPTQLDITLKATDGRTYDGLRIVYDNEYSNAIDHYDAVKFWNYTDNLSILPNDNYLSIEKRSIPSNADVTPLYFGSQSLDAYTFEILFASDDNFNAYLVDHYTDQTSAIPANAVFNYSFNVDPNIPESIAVDRFEIAYDNSTLSNNQFNSTNFSIYPNPLNSNESLYIQSEAELISNIEGVELLNLNGQILEEIPSALLDFSNNLVKISFNRNISSGPYLLKIKTTQKVSIYKIIVH